MDASNNVEKNDGEFSVGYGGASDGTETEKEGFDGDIILIAEKSIQVNCDTCATTMISRLVSEFRGNLCKIPIRERIKALFEYKAKIVLEETLNDIAMKRAQNGRKEMSATISSSLHRPPPPSGSELDCPADAVKQGLTVDVFVTIHGPHLSPKHHDNAEVSIQSIHDVLSYLSRLPAFDDDEYALQTEELSASGIFPVSDKQMMRIRKNKPHLDIGVQLRIGMTDKLDYALLTRGSTHIKESSFNPILWGDKYEQYDAYCHVDLRFANSLNTALKAIASAEIFRGVRALVIYVGSNYSRVDILRISEGIKQRLIEKVESVYFVGIREQELHTFYAALSTDNLFGVASLVLMTADLYVLHIDYPMPSSTSTTNPSVTKYCGFESYITVLSVIRQYNSEVFWRKIKSNGSLHAYYPDRILWKKGARSEEDFYIFSYLDFSQCMSDLSVRLLLEWNLCMFFPVQNGTLVKVIDSLVTPLLGCLPSNGVLADKKTVYSGLGSVYVTGESKRLNFTEGGDADVVYFFKHPNCKDSSHVKSIFLWDKEPYDGECVSEDKRLARIGKTALVTAGGWQHFPIDHRTVQIGGNGGCVVRSVRETYEDWQIGFPNLINAGNYKYDSYGDFFRIGIKEAVEYSFAQAGDLSQYLVAMFLGCLNPAELEKINNHYAVSERMLEIARIFTKEIRSGGIILYVSHANTDFVVSMIKSILPAALHERIHPIRRIRGNSKSISNYLSPLVLERIKKEVDDNGMSLSIFDCTISSGSTFASLSDALKYEGIERYRFFCILDRRRKMFEQPYDGKLITYWRLDIPRLNASGRNLISDGVSNIEHRLGLLNSDTLKEASETIVRNWKERDWNDPDLLKFTNDSRLEYELRPKKFGLPSGNGKEPENQIVIKTAFGLALHCAELYTMTGRDDYVSTKIMMSPEFEDKDNKANQLALLFTIATQLALFDDDISDLVRRELLVAGVKIIQRHKFSNRIAELFGVIVAGQRNEYKKMLYEYYDAQSTTNRQGKIGILPNNHSLKMAFTVLQLDIGRIHVKRISHEERDETGYEYLIRESSSSFYSNLIDYHNFVYRTGAMHESILNTMMNRREFSVSVMDNELLYALDYLGTRVDKIDFDRTICHDSPESLNEIKEEAKSEISKIKYYLKHGAASEEDVRSRLSNLVQGHLRKIWDLFFLGYTSGGKNLQAITIRLDNLIRKLQDRHGIKIHLIRDSGNDVVGILKTQATYSVVYDNKVEECLRDLLGNARHANKEKLYCGIYHAVVEISVCNDGVKLRGKNYFKRDKTSEHEINCAIRHIQSINKSLFSEIAELTKDMIEDEFLFEFTLKHFEGGVTNDRKTVSDSHS